MYHGNVVWSWDAAAAAHPYNVVELGHSSISV